MKKTLKTLSFLVLLASLISCGPSTSEQSTSTLPPTTSISEPASVETTTTTTTEEPKEYEKDEEGFFILEDDYFSSYSKDDGLPQSKLKYADYVENTEYSTYFRLYVGDKQIPIYNVKVNNGHSWSESQLSRIESGVAIINLEGRAQFKLQTKFLIHDTLSVRPLDKNVHYSIDENRRVVSFEITSTGQYTFEFRGGRTLHLFVNPYVGYESYAKYSNVIRFPKGVHTKSNNKYIDSNNKITLNSNTTVILEPGSIIEGAFTASNAENIQIIGDGSVSGANFIRDPIEGKVTVPYDFNYCKNIEFIGISTLDPAGWCYNIYFCNNVKFHDIKIISSRHNGDGISLQSTQNVEVTDCFLRTWDDSLVVKNYPRWYDRTQHGSTTNIKFKRCLLWTDLAQSMEIGFETVGKVMNNISFEDIRVLHNFHKAPISIHNANNADIRNVTFKNITIEDASAGLGDGWTRIIDFSNEFSSTWSTNHTTTSLGSTENVYLDNILFIEGTKNPRVRIYGGIDPREGFDKSIHYFNKVEFKDVYIYDKWLDETFENLEMKYAVDITFIKEREKVTGASICWKENTEYGANISISTF